MEIPDERSKREKRFTRRCEIEFTCEDITRRGISSNLSRNGLFVRTDLPFSPDSVIDLVVYLPDGTNALLKGKVMRSTKTSLGKVGGIHLKGFKNGMGVEIMNRDINYDLFIDAMAKEP